MLSEDMNTVNLNPVARQRGQHHGDLRASLMAAALELLDQAGADTLTLRAVARRAGVSPAAPYHHFEDKAALLSSVALDGFRQLGDAQDRIRARTPMRRVEALTSVYIRFALDHRSHYAVMVAALQTDESPDQVGPMTELALAAHLTFDHLVAAVNAARPDLSDDEARRRALQVWAQAHGTVMVIDVASGIDPQFTIDAVVAGAAAAARAAVCA